MHKRKKERSAQRSSDDEAKADGKGRSPLPPFPFYYIALAKKYEK